ncbi:DNA polymerase III subunit beta, partial [Candidatus Berkelbacteria bacterium]|nr:DNA polymerase III subunit beta [Candidatus Berkelbacteria bacterium]
KNQPDLDLILPSRTLQELARMLPDQDIPVQIFFAENQVLFTFQETELISRLIDGTFPEFEQIIPKQPTTTATIDKAAFIQVMKMASFFARESANNVQLKVTETGVLVTAISPQLGDTVAQLEATVTGEPVEIAFNAKFLLDALLIFPGQRVSLLLSGKLQAGILRPLDEKAYLYLLMPLRVDS